MGTCWSGWGEALLHFLYPSCCQVCGAARATAAAGYVCGVCRARPGSIRWVDPPYCERCGLPHDGDLAGPYVCANCHDVVLHFSQARSAVRATGLVREVLHRFKYHQAVWFAPFLVELLVTRAGPALAGGDWDAVVPVPLHGRRRRERGFNQASLLAQGLARALGLPCPRGWVRRRRPTDTQTRLNREQRRRNLRGAFAVPQGLSLSGRRIVLVDDVLTTGATTSAAALALRRAGAVEVCVWTVARGV